MDGLCRFFWNSELSTDLGSEFETSGAAWSEIMLARAWKVEMERLLQTISFLALRGDRLRNQEGRREALREKET